jgi:hypothetical protein
VAAFPQPQAYDQCKNDAEYEGQAPFARHTDVRG